MGKILIFEQNKKHIRRLAEREIKRMYQTTAGGSDRIIDKRSQELFEAGFIDEPFSMDWPDYCTMILAKLWEG